MAMAQDPGTSTPQGYNERTSVSVWTRAGRKMVDASLYMSCMEALKPDVFQLLADADTQTESSNKRTQKSVDASLNFAKICTDFKENSEILKDTPVFASIVGGYNTVQRLRCAKMITTEFDVDGYVIDGFHTNGESATQMKWVEVEPVLTETLVHNQL